MIYFLCLAVFSAGAAPGDREIRLGPGREHLRPVKYAVVEISGRVPERIPEIYVLRPDLHTLEDLVRRFNAAAEDNAIEGLIVRLGRFGGGWGKAAEIRNALRNVAGHGKEVIVYLEDAGSIQYYIATGADRIVMPHAGAFMLVGLRGEVMFLRGLFDKIGVTPDFVQVGDYKGASDPFVHQRATEEFDEVMNALFDSLFESFVSAIAAGRGVEADTVRELIDDGPYTVHGAVDAGLIDSVMFYDELLEEIRNRQDAPFELIADYGRQEVDSMPIGEGMQRLLRMMLGMRADMIRDPDPKDKTIAVLFAAGPVVMERPDSAMLDDSVIDARLIIRILEELREKPNVKAIVLRIESPGGDARASDMIWHALRRTDRVKPVISSISDVAGSGGYYVACGGRYIFAGEGSLTGSIGVMGGKFVVQDLFEKLGLNVEIYQRGRHAGLFSPVEEFSEGQKERFVRLLEDTYSTFLDRVADSRRMNRDEMQAVAEGRAFTGAQALELNLVDELGGLHDAVRHAAAAAGIDADEDVELLFLPKSQSLLDAIFLGRDIGVSLSPGPVRREIEGLMPDSILDGLDYLSAVSNLGDYQPAALMPAYIRIR